MATQTKTRRRLQWEATGAGEARTLWGVGPGRYVYMVEHQSGWTEEPGAALDVDGPPTDAWRVLLTAPRGQRLIGTFADAKAAQAAAEEHWQTVPAYRLIGGRRTA